MGNLVTSSSNRSKDSLFTHCHDGARGRPSKLFMEKITAWSQFFRSNTRSLLRDANVAVLNQSPVQRRQTSKEMGAPLTSFPLTLEVSL